MESEPNNFAANCSPMETNPAGQHVRKAPAEWVGGHKGCNSRIFQIISLFALVAMQSSGQATATGSEKAIEVLQRDEKAEVEVVTITPDGFYPRRLSRGPGPFVLFIENRAAVKGDLDLKLETESKALAKSLQIKDREIEVGELVRLPIGVYTLSLTGKNKYSFTLEIKAK